MADVYLCDNHAARDADVTLRGAVLCVHDTGGTRDPRLPPGPADHYGRVTFYVHVDMQAPPGHTGHHWTDVLWTSSSSTSGTQHDARFAYGLTIESPGQPRHTPTSRSALRADDELIALLARFL